MVKFRVLSLFAGIGGLELGLERSGGFVTAAQCEIDPYARRVLAAHWPDALRFDDVTTLRGRDAGRIDVICGGFPCQDASIANIGGLGTSGARTGLFAEIIRLARELGPQFILMENVANLLNRGFGDVLGALAEIGFDAEWECFQAREFGFDHERDRLFVLAYPERARRKRPQPYRGALGRAKATFAKSCDEAARARRALVEREQFLRTGDGLSIGMERRRLHGLGNAVVPQIPELIGRAILQSMEAAA